MSDKIVPVIFLALLGGCATCREHPAACAAVAAAVVTAVIVVPHYSHHQPPGCEQYYLQHGDTLAEAARDCR